ncbi:hypothetical protein FBUS_00848 [Fasciolopsis buskii]|uniref:Uncharacterized protein n=1 Tax=Fasciolopsis buskii TaxID=27845 RepID=A0A8E0VDK7_9TREM|nr:hypothetical protein FBUS_00848 [Fasciolopsis buski]
MLNDVFFALHALLICCLMLIQTLIYERGDQRVSTTCRSIVGFVLVYCIVFLIVCGLNLSNWLTFLYQLSYVKVLVTFMKYVPQVSRLDYFSVICKHVIICGQMFNLVQLESGFPGSSLFHVS